MRSTFGWSMTSQRYLPFLLPESPLTKGEWDRKWPETVDCCYLMLSEHYFLYVSTVGKTKRIGRVWLAPLNRCTGSVEWQLGPRAFKFKFESNHQDFGPTAAAGISTRTRSRDDMIRMTQIQGQIKCQRRHHCVIRAVKQIRNERTKRKWRHNSGTAWVPLKYALRTRLLALPVRTGSSPTHQTWRITGSMQAMSPVADPRPIPSVTIAKNLNSTLHLYYLFLVDLLLFHQPRDGCMS